MMLRMTALGTCLLGLTACEPSTQVMLTGASIVSLAHTEKTVGDHFNTWAFDKDCSIVQFVNGEEYCQEFEDEQSEIPQEQALHCYRTIGGVSCYREPDKSSTAQTKVY
ncbi:hypothetical protein [Pelagibius sp. Alg239-R121]|uniref:hypothetical protein n=1 Tax=Pelagibius sp. Alg239-R121 TaxID=2993448 RepID=UPI0024A75536|nr:hypothetical protein [Pelagibius sp. Alg239-R121]